MIRLEKKNSLSNLLRNFSSDPENRDAYKKKNAYIDGTEKSVDNGKVFVLRGPLHRRISSRDETQPGNIFKNSLIHGKNSSPGIGFSSRNRIFSPG